MNGRRNFALGVILVHLGITLVHGQAHDHLAIPMTHAQEIYIFAVIFIAPIVAGALLLTRAKYIGAWILLLAMAGSLAFGAFFHFVAGGPDNISSVSGMSWGATFQTTAVLLAFSELLGCWSAVRLLSRSSGRELTGR